MRRLAATSLLVLLAGSPALAAEAEPAARRGAEALLREAAQAEQAEDCESAYLKYKDAETALAGMEGQPRAAELESVVANKLDKLGECYQSCQASERQQGLFASARTYADQGEVKRAIQITRRLLVGKNEKCRFWAEARRFLRTLPNQAEQMDLDQIDPCEVTADVTASVEAARKAMRWHRERLGALEGDKKKADKVQEMIELYRDLDATRLELFDLREQFIECESVYRPLAEDGERLREMFGRTQEMLFTTYDTQVKGLSKKIQAFQKQLADKNRTLAAREKDLADKANELEQVRRQFEDLSSFTEELYGDLLDLSATESISFSTRVEGRRVEQPVDEIRALMADQAKLMKTMQGRYPEYFQDGVNLEGLKRKRFVLEKLEHMMGRFGRGDAGGRLGHERAMGEISTTIKLMDKVIAANEDKVAANPGVARKREVGGVPLWLGLPLGVGLALVLTGVVLMVRRKPQ